MSKEFGHGSFIEQQVGVNAVGGEEVGEKEAGGSSADDDDIVNFVVGGGDGVRGGLFRGGADLIIPHPSS